MLFTECQVYLEGGLVGIAEHDEILGRFPEPEHPVQAAGFAQIEQNLVTGEVFFRTG